MTGHIRRRGERSWEIKFDLGTDPLTGKRLTLYHSVKGTKREAKAELTKLKADADQKKYIEQTKLTVNGFLARWKADWADLNLSKKAAESCA
jgi:integrase